ncbi:4-hydroxybutyrate dehydrogenase [Anaerofilum sp. BX8]|uniref:4-hydroxybutyrate dehydrogenase n=1 Tax=Anaerofilum hominis TaxID=2763016 RepID=A0A923I742_9FIRM|nr:4-hydroxybutyrate dehydrogenase [Anaerofilum hominis]MBC5581506.1 4-hydroxybutyrate dehydrogenase [Anaerofilum hominis]
MKQFELHPALCRYDSCEQFCRELKIGRGDLILTNEFLYRPFFDGCGSGAQVIFQEKYGGGEPSDEMAEAIWRDVQGDPQRIIGIGGGTVLDLSKLFALETVTPVLDLYDKKIEPRKKRRLVLVPTTCGTGSEVTNISILELKSRSTKLGLAHEALYADEAALVPELLRTLPYRFFATSSIDALIHAVESSVSPRATAYTKLFGYRAIGMILKGYRRIQREGQQVYGELLDDFLTASNFAGCAFSNAGCGAVHAMSYPLSGKYHVAHGEANYALFTGIFRNYMEISAAGRIDELNGLLAAELECPREAVYERLEELLSAVLVRKPLREYGVTLADLDDFTANVMEKQGRITANNFVLLDAARVRKIYGELY